MKNIDFKDISLKELAAIVSQKLRDAGIDTVLVGGGCVSIYSKNRYQSYDLDYVTHEDMKKVSKVLQEINFIKKGRHFAHTACPFFIEFIAPPVAIGNDPIENYEYHETALGTIKMLKATDSVKDRLASYYHWDDPQGLDQAINICQEVPEKVDLQEIKTWSKKESHESKYETFIECLKGS